MLKMITSRLKQLVLKMLSLSFITWCIVSYMYIYNVQDIDMNYLLFTASLIGIKTFKQIKQEVKNNG